MTDSELATRAKKGDHSAFVELAHRYQNPVYRLVYRFAGNAEDAADLGQDCLIRAYAQMHRYDPNRPFLPWLMRVSTNVCLNAKAVKTRRQRYEAPWDDELVDFAFGESGADPEQQTMDSIQRQEVLQALDGLPDETRLLLVMRFVNGLSLREIAEATGCKLSTVAFRITRGVETLRTRLAPSAEVRQ